MPIRLKLEQIQPTAKIVHRMSTWSTPAHVTAGSAEAEHVARIIRAIERGNPIPTVYFRKGVGLSPDFLLETEGIMHLHLGKPNTPELLYLVQYPTDVVLLEVSDHSHFVRPIGARLKAVHDTILIAKEAEIDAAGVKPKLEIKRRTGAIPKAPAKLPRSGDPA